MATKSKQESEVGATHSFIDETVAHVGAVKSLVPAATTAAMQRHTAREVQLTGGFWVLLGHLNTHLSRLARRTLDLFQNDWKQNSITGFV